MNKFMTTSQKQSVYQQCRNLINFLDNLAKISPLDIKSFFETTRKLSNVSLHMKKNRHSPDSLKNQELISELTEALHELSMLIVANRQNLDSKVLTQLLQRHRELYSVLEKSEQMTQAVMPDNSTKLQTICSELNNLLTNYSARAKIVITDTVKADQIEIHVDSDRCTSEVEYAVKLLERVNVTAVNDMLDEIKQKFTPEQRLMLKYKL